MILQTGIFKSIFVRFYHRKRFSRGFTFVEVMATLAVLTFGLVFIYRAFFISLDYINHSAYRLYAMTLLNNRITLLQRVFQEQGTIPIGRGKTQERILIHRKPVDFNYQINFFNVGNLKNITRADVSLLWKEGRRNVRLTRSAYLTKRFDD